MKKILILYLLLLFCYTPGAISDPVVQEYCRKNEKHILTNFVSLLSIPNQASDTENIRRNAEWIVGAMRSRGLNPRLLQAKDPVAPPAVYGELKVPGAVRTLLFYAHYDGQPADPEQWSITHPWKPVFRNPGTDKNLTLQELKHPVDPEMRLYARSASDDKAGVMGILSAVDAARDLGLAITCNIKFFFEGEEEAGSSHLDEITSQHRELLLADAWILIDGPVHPSGKKLVDFGVRGDANVDLTVYGPVRPLHSGHYGNWAPNPAMSLARLLASMKEDSGRVLVEGWYEDVTKLSDKEMEAINAGPHADEQLRAELGIASPDGSGKKLLELIHEPSLNINGMKSADVGEHARNVIPTTAMATLDLRLVKGNDVQKQFDKLVKHITKQGYFVIDREPTIEERRSHARLIRVKLVPGAYNAQRTPMDLPISEFVLRAVQSTSSEKVVVWPSAGGSLPLSIVEKNLQVPMINVPMANHDNNQHAENENIRLQNFWNGIETITAILTTK
jgi:acetylornithine deacetylase/succinyl-diaminopimelate desuccinylase-like protein